MAGGAGRAFLRYPPEPPVAILPPDVMRDGFAQVGFHPLSINVLTALRRQRRIADVAWSLRTQLPGAMIRCWGR
jgi:hypothetical protein